VTSWFPHNSAAERRNCSAAFVFVATRRADTPRRPSESWRHCDYREAGRGGAWAGRGGLALLGHFLAAIRRQGCRLGAGWERAA
jgi:hypothetical protein